MPSDESTLVVTLVGALLSSAVPAIGARLSESARVRQAEHKLKRIEVIEKLLEVSEKNGTGEDFPRESLLSELSLIARSVPDKSARIAADRLERFYEQPVIRRMLALPSPMTVMGWFGFALYYLYGGMGIFYMVVGVASIARGQPVFFAQAGSAIMFFSTIMAFGLSWLGHWLVMRSLKNQLRSNDNDK